MRTVSIFILFLMSVWGCAQTVPTDKEQKRILRKVRKAERQQLWKEKEINLLGFPVLYYSPETRLAGGVAGIFLFRTQLDSITQQSQIGSNAIYTLNDQIIFFNPFQVFTGRNRYFFTGELSFYRYPYIFAGIGNNHEVDDPLEDYTAAFPRLDATVYRNITGNFFGGVNLWYQNMLMLEKQDGGLLEQTDVTGSDGGVTSGIGLSILYDSRDLVTSPTTGWFASFSQSHFSGNTWSDFDYDNYNLDIRRYQHIKNKHLIAFQFVADINSGAVPFNRMAMLGGEQIMRGFQRGIFRDQCLTNWQVEYRSKPFFNFLAATAFVSQGGVGSDIQQATDNLRWGYGGGLRLLLNKEKRLFIRFDMGFGKDTQGFYFNIGEAF